ncbi:MAG: bacillithiol system redox-active protein YtxJ [Sphaerospermopsis sp. SIO1G2]|nr:bacillithiol system redox-active protein YtxJ [Sphaerospermopsis sp. SIO1G2]
MTIAQLTSPDHVDQVVVATGLTWLFKHSNACPTSFAALDQVETYHKEHAAVPIHMVVVQTDRPVSNYIAETLSRVHQSPQLFLLNNGEVVWSGSHWGITAEAMQQAVEAAQ